ncbi:HNH endonuclease signature motif containing protein [Neobacillus vireti]|uniref:HNH endonuclease n=1 Tax=Neobacillus vireti TaxID=220686 RepID=UPI00300019D2
MRLQEEHLALSSGMGLAGLAVSNFWDYSSEAFSVFKDEIIASVLKPTPMTAIHHYLYFFQDIEEELDKIYKNVDNLQWTYDFIVRTLDGVNMKTDFPEPDFEGCSDKYHSDCECKRIVEQLIEFVEENQDEIDKKIVHSAFQFVFQDRQFLHDFHLQLAGFIEENIGEIAEKYPDFVTPRGRIKRAYFPKWLTEAVFHRDKGTCSNPECRCDLSHLIRRINIKHIDHIVPLNLFGTNDASNFQLLCETCNTQKGDRSTMTGSVNTPWWNLD